MIYFKVVNAFIKIDVIGKDKLGKMVVTITAHFARYPRQGEKAVVTP